MNKNIIRKISIFHDSFVLFSAQQFTQFGTLLREMFCFSAVCYDFVNIESAIRHIAITKYLYLAFFVNFWPILLRFTLKRFTFTETATAQC